MKRALVILSCLVAFPAAAQTDPDAGVPDAATPASTAPTASGPDTATTPAATTPAATTPSATATTSPPARTTRAAPPPSREPAPTTDEDEDEDEDSWGVFYLQALAGYSFANVVQFSQENFVPEATDLQGSGLYGGLGLGFRLYWITLGAQATLASYFGFEIGTAGLDVALHLPIPVVQPYLRVGIGYAWMGDADYTDPMLSQTDVYGYAIDAGLGLDIKLARFLSLGAGFDAAFLNMTRQSLSDGNVTGVDIQEDGDAVGLQIRLHAQLTLHI